MSTKREDFCQILLSGLVLGVASVGMEALVVSPVLDDITQAFGIDIGRAGMAVTSYGIALALAAPVIGWFGDRLPRRALMLMGLTLFVAAGLICALAPDFNVLLVGRALCGVAAGAYLPSCYAFVGDSVPYAQRGRIMGRIMFGWSIALILGIPFGAVLAQFFGWRVTFGAVALLGATAAVTVAFASRSMARPSMARPRPCGPLNVTKHVGQILRMPAVPLMLAVNFFDMAGFYVIYTYIGSAVRQRLGIGSGAAGIFVLLYGCGLMISTLNGSAIDRIGKRKTLAMALIALSLLLALLPAAMDTPVLLAIMSVLWGTLQGAAQTCTATILTRQSDIARGFVTALMSSTTYLAVACGSLLGGAIIEHIGFMGLGLAGGASSLAALMLFVGFVPRVAVGDWCPTSLEALPGKPCPREPRPSIPPQAKRTNNSCD